jgi:hypothetical protein
MKRLIALTVMLLALTAQAQFRGVPPSVTSMGFGGHRFGGVPGSVTSFGPHGFGGHFHKPFFHKPFFGGFAGGVRFGHFSGGVRFGHFNPGVRFVTPFPFKFRHHSFHKRFVWSGPVYYAGAYAPYVVQPDVIQAAPDDYEQQIQRIRLDELTREEVRRAVAEELDAYFAERERRLREEAAPPSPAKPPQPAPQAEVRESPFTVLVFRDGHREEVRNYAIVDSTVHVMSPYRRKIPLADLDLDATTQANEDRGIVFRVPKPRSGRIK